MSAKKCKYSAKFKPLVIAMRAAFNNDEKKLFDWAGKHFTDPALAISRSNAGNAFLSDLKIDSRKLEGKTDDVDSIKTYYATNNQGYNECIREFTNRIIESTVYNYNTNEFIDAEATSKELDGYSQLNLKLLQYKIDLVNTITSNHYSLEDYYEDGTTNISIDKLNRAISNAILLYEQFLATSTTIDKEQYQAYVILKNFNKLIEERTPFIKIKKEFENTSTHGVDMYEYHGPNVKHRVSFTTNEHISATSQYSDLAKILLNYFPEYLSKPITDKNIGTDGFVSVMMHFKSALIYGDDKDLSKFRKIYYEGRLNDIDPDTNESYMLGALKAYQKVLSTKSVNKTTKTALTGKLGGIIHYIYESELPVDIKEMFTSMFMKTSPLKYRTYSMNKDSVFGKLDLNDSFVQSQILDIKEIINGQVLLHQTNPLSWIKFKQKYNVQIEGSLEKGTITISDKSGFLLKIKSNKKTRENWTFMDFSCDFDSSKEPLLYDFIQDLFGTILPLEDYKRVAHIYAGDEIEEFEDPTIVAEDFSGLIAAAVFGSEQNSNILYDNNKTVNFKDNYLWNAITEVATVLSTVYGQDTRNVVEDVNGNKLPTNGLTSLAFNMPKYSAEMTSTDEDRARGLENTLQFSFLAPKYSSIDEQYSTPGFEEPIIRQGVRINGTVKKVSDLTLSELLELAITYDFLDDVKLNKESDIYSIGLQPGNFADKERQFIVSFLTKGIEIDGNSYNMGYLIRAAAKGNASAISQLENVWRLLRNQRYSILEQNFVKEYNAAMGWNFSTLKEIDDALIANPISIDELRIRFRSAGCDFVENSTAEEVNNIARVNSTALNYIETFKDPKKAQARLKRSRAYFAKDIWKSRLKLSKHTNNVIKEQWDLIPTDWKEKRKDGKETGNLILFRVKDARGNEVKINSLNSDIITDSNYTVELNPILNAYMMSDIIYSNEYVALATNDCFGHSHKGGDNEEEIEALRLVAANKRNVIYGASIHAFSHNLSENRGVSKRIKISVVKDIKAAVWNMIGGLDDKFIDDKIDSMDGSGIQSIYEAILEQESLKDAAAGVDEKTILGWQDKYHGTQILLKWAVYALTNERRRASRNSTVNGEAIFKKMHSMMFNKTLDMNALFLKHVSSDIYFKDFESGKHYKIIGVETKDSKQARKVIEVTSNGREIGSIQYLDNRNKIYDTIDEIADANLTYNTLYDLDQFFGGCDEESLIDGELRYTNRGNHIVTDIICENNLKDYFVSYIVNKSAIKVGATNINQSDVLDDNDLELDTMEMSTEYGGLQMNAEHELEDSEISEMTQMVSALIEKGFSYEIVKQIYSDIGAVVLDALSNIRTAIANNASDPNKLKVIFGRALIEAYAKGDRDTLGLAQAFLVKAEKYLRENDIKDFTFPFSGATINPSFIATVSSMITKKGIRRKYAGVAAVLTPSYNMIQVYGNGKLLDKYADEIRAWKTEHPEYAGVSIKSLMNDIEINGELNPFIELDPNKEFSFEDTIVVRKWSTTNDGKYIVNTDGSHVYNPNYETVVIDSYEKYDFYKNIYDGQIRVFKSKPRNLKGSDITFRDDSRKYSIYESSAVRAANYSKKKTTTSEEKGVILRVLKDAIVSRYDDIVWTKLENATSLLDAIEKEDLETVYRWINVRKTLYNIVQSTLTDLQERGVFRDPILTGNAEVAISNLNVSAAEVVMGKQWAKQFHLKAGDDINEILTQKSKFFYNRISNLYSLPAIDKNLYDGIAYTKEGKPILVAISDDYNFEKSRNADVTTVDGKAYLNGKFLCDSKDKEFYKVQSGNQLYDVVVVKSVEDYQDFVTSDEITFHRINYENDPVIAMQLAKVFLSDDEYEEILKKPTEETLVDLPLKESARVERLLWQKAQNMFNSFELSLNMVGSRIPAQAMQSFQPLRVVAFTDSETNDIYVNRHQTYLEGSDFDIDKSYIMTYEVGNDGIIDTGTRLAKYVGIEKSFELKTPTGQEFKVVNNGTILSENDVYGIISGDIDTINKILSGSRFISFAESSGKDKLRYERVKERALYMLNLHERSHVSDAAIRNKVVYGILKVAKDARNQLNFTSPVSTDAQQNAADNSDLGKDERHISMDTPSSKYMMQEQNMVGKQCIGITAVALKCFFTKSYYYNDILNDKIPEELAKGNIENAIKLLGSITFKNPSTGKTTVLSNVNLNTLIKFVEDEGLQVLSGFNTTEKNLLEWNKEDGFHLLDALKVMKKRSNRVDCALELSGLLSSATDNAKLLILSKINATTKFIDIYTVALQMGCTFEEVASLMTHPIFNAMSRLVGSNILKPYRGNYRVDQVIDFYLGENIDLPKINDRRKKLMWELFGTKDVYTEGALLKLLKDNTKVEAALDNAYAKINKLDSESSNRNSNAKEDWLIIADLLEEVIDKNNVLAKLESTGQRADGLNKLDIIKKTFIPATEEQTILGALLGVNQGLKTSGYQQFNLCYRTEAHVNSLLGLSGEDSFSLLKFLRDDEYAAKMIAAYESKKKFTNILAVIKDSPHFKEMLSAMSDNNLILTTLSSKYDLATKLAYKISDGGKYGVSEKEYKQIEYFINDSFIVSFLTAKGIKFNVSKETPIYDHSDIAKPARTSQEKEIKDLYDLASFKLWMETEVIPLLKESPEYAKSTFIQNLMYSVTIDRRTKKPRSFYRLPMNMLLIDQYTDSRDRYQAILTDFNKIARNKLPGSNLTIADAFFVYNAIVNKEGFGRNSMTRLFEDLINSENGTSLASEFYDFISQIDTDEKLRNEFEQTILSDNGVQDARTYIKTNVLNTYVKGTEFQFGPDFTFFMNSKLRFFQANSPDIEPYVSKDKSDVISAVDIRNAVAEHVRDLCGRDNVQIHAFSESESGTNAYIKNGVIHIDNKNSDAPQIIHEYAHMILAVMKFSPEYQNLYYSLINMIRQHPDYEDIAERYREKGILGSDLREEVFCTIFENYLRNRIESWAGTDLLNDNNGTIVDIIKRILSLNVPNVDISAMDLGSSTITDVIKVFGSNLFNFNFGSEMIDSIRKRIDLQYMRSKLMTETINGEPRIEENCD